MVENKSLARNGSGKRNVFVWDSSTQFADQYWYFNKKSNGNYEIKSALTYSYYLNVDTNKNISVAPKRNNVFQEFRLDRIN
ncbi:hypothetical protein [Photobacterium leiognathi]|uniref:hypothetical protein n=1 Tax=Photobacterium leiognathi TaxID=553611 RepID=UPI0034E39313